MDLPAKRKNSQKRSVLSSQKKPKTLLLEKINKSLTNPGNLRKDLWVSILDFLDTWSYFHIIPQISTFFYFIIKNSKNYRTSFKLPIIVKFSKPYNETYNIYIKNSKSMEYILNCQQLNKLEITLGKEEKNIKNTLKPISSFDKYFIPMLSLNTLKILKIYVIEGFFSYQIENLLILLINLEILKVKFKSSLPDGFCFIENTFIKNYETTSHPKTHLRKLSLEYYKFRSKGFYIINAFESLDKNIGLEKFSIKATVEITRRSGIYKFLRTNCYLKSIKLGQSFSFSKTSAEELCSYLAKSLILEELSISDTIMICYKEFSHAILINRSLKILDLKYGMIRNSLDFMKNSDSLITIIDAVAHSFIEDFSIKISIIDNHFNYINQNQELDLRTFYSKIEKFIESLDNFISTSESIRKLDFKAFKTWEN